MNQNFFDITVQSEARLQQQNEFAVQQVLHPCAKQFACCHKMLMRPHVTWDIITSSMMEEALNPESLT